MQVKKYKSVVVSVKKHFDDLYTLEFASTGSRFKYYPGQFLHLALDQNYDGIGQWPVSRCFSMQSNPDMETVLITYSVKGNFTKKMMGSIKEGTHVWLKMPYGDLFTQKHNKTNTVFIAGGTGITPFLSLFTHRTFSEYINPRIYLGFRSLDYNKFDNFLIHAHNSTMKVKIFYQDIDGVIDVNSICEENGLAPDFFLSGPPVMIKTIKNELSDRGVPLSRILTDEWD